MSDITLNDTVYVAFNVIETPEERGGDLPNLIRGKTKDGTIWNLPIDEVEKQKSIYGPDEDKTFSASIVSGIIFGAITALRALFLTGEKETIDYVGIGRAGYKISVFTLKLCQDKTIVSPLDVEGVSILNVWDNIDKLNECKLLEVPTKNIYEKMRSAYNGK